MARFAESRDAGARFHLDDDLGAAVVEARDPAVGGDEWKIDLGRADRRDRRDGGRVVFRASGRQRRSHCVTARSPARRGRTRLEGRPLDRLEPVPCRRTVALTSAAILAADAARTHVCQ